MAYHRSERVKSLCWPIINVPFLFRKTVLKFDMPFGFLQRRMQGSPDELFLIVEPEQRACAAGIFNIFNNEF